MKLNLEIASGGQIGAQVQVVAWIGKERLCAELIEYRVRETRRQVGSIQWAALIAFRANKIQSNERRGFVCRVDATDQTDACRAKDFDGE